MHAVSTRGNRQIDKYSTSHCKVVQMKITFALQILWGNFHAKMITIFNEDPWQIGNLLLDLLFDYISFTLIVKVITRVLQFWHASCINIYFILASAFFFYKVPCNKCFHIFRIYQVSLQNINFNKLSPPKIGTLV